MAWSVVLLTASIAAGCDDLDRGATGVWPESLRTAGDDRRRVDCALIRNLRFCSVGGMMASEFDTSDFTA